MDDAGDRVDVVDAMESSVLFICSGYGFSFTFGLEECSWDREF